MRSLGHEKLVALDSELARLVRASHAAELAGLRAQLAASEREHPAIAAAIAVCERGGRDRASEALASAHEVEVVLAASQASR